MGLAGLFAHRADQRRHVKPLPEDLNLAEGRRQEFVELAFVHFMKVERVRLPRLLRIDRAIGRGDDEHTTRPQHPADLGDKLPLFDDVLEGLHRDDEIEAPVGKRQGSTVALLETQAFVVVIPPTGPLHGRIVDLEAHDARGHPPTETPSRSPRRSPHREHRALAHDPGTPRSDASAHRRSCLPLRGRSARVRPLSFPSALIPRHRASHRVDLRTTWEPSTPPYRVPSLATSCRELKR